MNATWSEKSHAAIEAAYDEEQGLIRPLRAISLGRFARRLGIFASPFLMLATTMARPAAQIIHVATTSASDQYYGPAYAGELYKWTASDEVDHVLTVPDSSPIGYYDTNRQLAAISVGPDGHVYMLVSGSDSRQYYLGIGTYLFRDDDLQTPLAIFPDSEGTAYAYDQNDAVDIDVAADGTVFVATTSASDQYYGRAYAGELYKWTPAGGVQHVLTVPDSSPIGYYDTNRQLAAISVGPDGHVYMLVSGSDSRQYYLGIGTYLFRDDDLQTPLAIFPDSEGTAYAYDQNDAVDIDVAADGTVFVATTSASDQYYGRAYAGELYKWTPAGGVQHVLTVPDSSPIGYYDTNRQLAAISVGPDGHVYMLVSGSDSRQYYLGIGTYLFRDDDLQTPLAIFPDSEGTAYAYDQNDAVDLDVSGEAVRFAVNKDAPFHITQDGPFDSPTFPVAAGSMPAIPLADAYVDDLIAAVKQIFLASNVDGVVFTKDDIPGAISVYFCDLPGPLEGKFIGSGSFPDRFNETHGETVLADPTYGHPPTLSLTAEIVAHEVGHALGLCHVDPPQSADPLDEEVMDYHDNCGSPGCVNKFIDAVSPTFVVLSHNPIYHLERYTDLVPAAQLDASGTQFGTWDVGVIELIESFLDSLFSVRASDSATTMYDVDIVADDGGDIGALLAHYDELTLQELGELQFKLPKGSFFQILAASAPGLPKDIALSKGDPFVAGNLQIPFEAGVTQLFLQQETASGYETVATVNLVGTPASTGPWTSLGNALAGSNGYPALVASGSLIAGSSGAVLLTNAKSNARAALLASLSSTPIPFKGGILVPVPPARVFAMQTNSDGSSMHTWSNLPAGIVPGTTFFFQYAIVDSIAPQGVSLSNAVKGVAP